MYRGKCRTKDSTCFSQTACFKTRDLDSNTGRHLGKWGAVLVSILSTAKKLFLIGITVNRVAKVRLSWTSPSRSPSAPMAGLEKTRYKA